MRGHAYTRARDKSAKMNKKSPCARVIIVINILIVIFSITYVWKTVKKK